MMEGVVIVLWMLQDDLSASTQELANVKAALALNVGDNQRKITDLETELQKCLQERHVLVSQLAEASSHTKNQLEIEELLQLERETLKHQQRSAVSAVTEELRLAQAQLKSCQDTIRKQDKLIRQGKINPLHFANGHNASLPAALFHDLPSLQAIETSLGVAFNSDEHENISAAKSNQSNAAKTPLRRSTRKKSNAAATKSNNKPHATNKLLFSEDALMRDMLPPGNESYRIVYQSILPVHVAASPATMEVLMKCGWIDLPPSAE